MSLAEAGDAAAQTELGERYEDGRDVALLGGRSSGAGMSATEDGRVTASTKAPRVERLPVSGSANRREGGGVCTLGADRHGLPLCRELGVVQRPPLRSSFRPRCAGGIRQGPAIRGRRSGTRRAACGGRERIEKKE